MTFRSLWNQYRFLVPIIISNKNNTSIREDVHLNYGNSANRKKIPTPKSNKKYLLISNGHYYYYYVINYLALTYTGDLFITLSSVNEWPGLLRTYTLDGNLNYLNVLSVSCHYCCCYYYSTRDIPLLVYKTSRDKKRYSLYNIFVPEKRVFFCLAQTVTIRQNNNIINIWPSASYYPSP